MTRDERLIRLSREHHHGLVMALRIQRELPRASEEELASLYSDLVRFWATALAPHCGAEDDALLARLAAHEDEGLALAGHLQREHRELEALLDRMRDAGAAADRRGMLVRFGELLGEHIRWEERDLFEWLQQRFEGGELDEIGALLNARLPEVPVACPTPQSL
jgi:hemerythrin-like domain-containing protein